MAKQLFLNSSDSSYPILEIKNTNSDTKPSEIKFIKASATPEASDNLGKLTFYGNTNVSSALFSEISSTANGVAHELETGSLDIEVKSRGSKLKAFEIDGSTASSYLDIRALNSSTDVHGTFYIGSSSGGNKFSVAAGTGNTSIAGTLGVTGNFNIANNMFTVTAATGNTTIGGTLTVSKSSSISSSSDSYSLTVTNTNNNALQVSGNSIILGNSISSAGSDDKLFNLSQTINDSTGYANTETYTMIKGALTTTDSSGYKNVNLIDLHAGSSPASKFKVASSGNTTIAGTLGVTGASTLSNTLRINTINGSAFVVAKTANTGTAFSVSSATDSFTTTIKSKLKIESSANTYSTSFLYSGSNDINYTLPTTAPTSGQVLQGTPHTNNGTYTLSWESSSGSSALNNLSDVKSNISNFSNSLLISTNTYAPNTNNLSAATHNVIVSNGGQTGSAGTFLLTTGDKNIVIGNNSFTSATTSSNNVILGDSSCEGISTGNRNTVIGAGSGSGFKSNGILDTAGSSTTVFTLELGQNGTADFYNGYTVTFTSGQNNGESRIITGYTSSRVATVSSAFSNVPSSGDTYEIKFTTLTTPTVNSGSSTTVFTANSTGLTATADLYNDLFIKFKSDTTTAAIRNEIRKITDYTTSYVFTLDTPLSSTPANGDTFEIFHSSALTTGNNNVFVGTNSGGDGTSSNQTSIGFESVCTAENQVTLGNSSVTALRCADTTIASLSDQRDKTNIVDSTYGLDFLNTIRPVQYTWNRRHIDVGDSTSVLNGKTRIGFLAQELQSAMPNNENEILDLVYDVNPDRLEAKYGNLIPVLVKAVQELSAQNQTLTDRITALENA